MPRCLATLLALLVYLTAWCGAPLDTRLTYCDDLKAVSDSTVLFDIDPAARQILIEARASLDKKSAKGYWGLVWGDVPTDYYSAIIQRRDGTELYFGDEPYLRLILSHITDGGSEEIAVIPVTSGIDARQGVENSIQVIFTPSTGQTSISLGHKDYKCCYEGVLTYSLMPMVWGLQSRGKLNVIEAAIAESYSKSENYTTAWTFSAIDERIGASADPVEGFYSYIDRDCDDDLGRLGGDYRLAIVADGNGAYAIIYISGATIYPAEWREGMLKGRLHPTNFIGRYGLEWIDSSFEPVTRDCYATIEQEEILTINFPYYSSKFRFYKERKP